MLMNKGFDKATFKRGVIDNIKNMFRRTIDKATPQQVFQTVAFAVRDAIIDEWIASHKEYEKKDVETVYYLSMEFSMGRALSNNIINICAHDEIKEVLDELGSNLSIVEDQEPDAALGNGSLGHLAACFLDSLATLGYPAYGYGIRYHYSTFKQKIENRYRVGMPDEWLKDGSLFEIRRPEYAQEVKFGGYVHVENVGGVNHLMQDDCQTVRAVPYDLPVIDYGNNMVNILRIQDTEPVNTFNLDSFDRGDYQKAVEQENLAKTIMEVLYPNDNHCTDKELRLKQQYFFVSANVQRTITRYKGKHGGIRKFHEKVMFQLNDTHPVAAVPELVYILLDEEGLTWEEAWDATTRACTYTNHITMSEALEKWPIGLFSCLFPRIYQIVEEISRRFQDQIQSIYPGSQDRLRSVSITYDGQAKIAYMAIAASFFVSGVARLYTEILKNQELKDFYQMMSERFDNRTNGITQRRFLLHGNPLLANWVTSKTGDEWITDLPHIKKLEIYANDEKCQQEFLDIKYQNKVRLVKYVKERNGIDVDPRSIFDVQVKGLHEYKRQLMNILRMMYLYSQLKDNPEMDMVPRIFIFGAKATAGYKRAKLTIKLINSVTDMINNDKSIGGEVKMVSIENYHASNTELIFAAADAGEQISTASKEASGAGNMKSMLNGALTLGTVDGTSMEVVGEVGQEYTLIFGISSDEVINYENNGGYYPMGIFNNDQEIRRVLMQLINGYYTPNNPELFRDICNSLLNTKSNDKADTYFILRDFRSYTQTHEKVDQAFRNEKWWAKVAILSISGSGKFTSDRTIKEYARDIWHFERVTVEM